MAFRWRFATIPLLFSLLMGVGFRPGATSDTKGPAYSWLGPQNLSQTAGRSIFPVIASTGAGDLLVVWTDYSGDPHGDILARQRLGGAMAWSPIRNLSESPKWDEGVALYADNQGRVHAAWTRRAVGMGTGLVYRQWFAGQWSPPVTLDHSAVFHPAPYGLFFVQDISATLWLFVNEGSGVSYTRLQGLDWSPLSPWVYVQGMHALGAIVSGEDGLFHAAALGENEDAVQGCDPWLEDAYYTTTDGTDWTPLVNLTYTGTIAFDVGLALDSTRAPHFSWSDIHPTCSVDSERSAVYERVLVNGTWGPRSEVTVPNEAQAVEDLAILANPSGQLHLAWSEGLFDEAGRATQLSIRCRAWSDGAWGEEEMVFGSVADSLNVDLALNWEGEPTVVWEEGAATAEEVYFKERKFMPYRLFFPWTPRAGALPVVPAEYSWD